MMRLVARLRRHDETAVLLAALAVAVVMALAHVAGHGVEVNSWVRVGEYLVTAEDLPSSLEQEPGYGYDGRFYYRLARAPTSLEDSVDGIELDRPAFRHQRITYPLVAWVLSAGGIQPVVPWALIGANVLALAAASVGLAVLLRRRGRSPWMGLAAAALPASVVAFHFDLAEATEAACLIWSLVALDRRSWRWAVVAMTVGALARETALVLPLAVVVSTLLVRVPWARRWGLAADRTPTWVGVVPIAIYLAWSGAISRLWETPSGGVSKSAEHFRPDPLGLVRVLPELLSRSSFDIVAITLFLAIGFLGVVALRDRDAGLPHERLALLGSTVIAITYSGWDRAIVYLRHPGVWVLFAAVVALSTPAGPRTERRVAPVLIALPLLAVLVTWQISVLDLTGA